MIRVLILDDDPVVARLVQDGLAEQRCECEAVVSVPAALRRLEQAPFDFVVLDRDDARRVQNVLDAFQLTRRCGFQVLRPKRRAAWRLPSLLPPALQRARDVEAAVAEAAQRFVMVPAFFSGEPYGRGVAQA